MCTAMQGNSKRMRNLFIFISLRQGTDKTSDATAFLCGMLKKVEIRQPKVTIQTERKEIKRYCAHALFFFCVFARTSQRAGQTTSPNTSWKALELTYKKGTRTLPSEVALPARKTNSEESASPCQNRPTTPEGRKAKPSSTQEQQRATKRSAKKLCTCTQTNRDEKRERERDTNTDLFPYAGNQPKSSPFQNALPEAFTTN